MSSVIKSVHTEKKLVYVLNTLTERGDLNGENEEDVKRLITRDREKEELLRSINLEKERILSEAKAQADQILLESNAKVEEARAQAWDCGYKEGVEHGLATAKQEVTQLIREAQEILNKAMAEREEIINSAVPVIVDIAINAAEKIIRQSIELDQEIVVEIAKAALEKALHGGETTLYCNPLDVPALNERIEEISYPAQGKRVNVVGSGNITQGGCVIHTELGMIDARIESQLAEIRTRLIEMVGND